MFCAPGLEFFELIAYLMIDVGNNSDIVEETPGQDEIGYKVEWH